MRFRAALLLFAAMGAAAQAPPQPPAAPPAFLVVSIKPSQKSAFDVRPFVRNGRWTERSVTLDDLIAYAYHLHCCAPTVEGGPAWVNKTGFAIVATASARNVPDGQLRLMVRQMLQARFGLRTHATTKVEPVYTLTVAPGGPKLQPASGNCDPNAPALGPVGPRPPCGWTQQRGQRPDTYHFALHSVTMAELAEFMEYMFALPEPHPVVDQTGLQGRFDLGLDYTMLNAPHGGPPNADPDTLHSNLVNFTKAMSAQAGLKLDIFHTIKLPIAVRVVDQAALPSN